MALPASPKLLARVSAGFPDRRQASGEHGELLHVVQQLPIKLSAAPASSVAIKKLQAPQGRRPGCFNYLSGCHFPRQLYQGAYTEILRRTEGGGVGR